LANNSNVLKKISLYTVLILPLVALITLTASLIGMLSYWNGQKAVDQIAQQLHSAIAVRIKEHMQKFLETPNQILDTNVYLIGYSMLDPRDTEALQRHFLEQVKTHTTLTSIYFGLPTGGITGSGREGAKGEFYVYSTGNLTAGDFKKYRVDSDGNPKELLVTVPGFDARTRSWYRLASQKDGISWSEVYILATGQDLAIAASHPIFDQKEKFVGVISVDIFLSHLSDFLKSFEISKSGEGYIIERSGYLVAASGAEKIYFISDNNGQPERLLAWESENPLIRDSADYLLEKFGDYQLITGEQQLKFEIKGERQFLSVLPVTDPHGIDWLIVVVVPESDFMAEVWANNRSTAIILILITGLALFLGISITKRIANRISELNRSTHALAARDWDGALASNSKIKEINELAISYNNMGAKLRQLLENLQSEIAKRSLAEHTLRESEDRYRTLVENIPIGVFRSTLDGKILTANTAFLEMFAIESLQNQDALNASCLYVNKKEHVSITKKLLEDGSLDKIETRFKTKNGVLFWGCITAIVIKDEQGEILYYDGTIENISAQKISRDRLKFIATHDLITNLPNRSLFNDRLDLAIKRAKRETTLVAVLYLDLDGYKKINDTYGHKQGDRLLQVVAKRLIRCVRASDTVARIGGDEFAVILEKLRGCPKRGSPFTI